MLLSVAADFNGHSLKDDLKVMWQEGQSPVSQPAIRSIPLPDDLLFTHMSYYTFIYFAGKNLWGFYLWHIGLQTNQEVEEIEDFSSLTSPRKNRNDNGKLK